MLDASRLSRFLPRALMVVLALATSAHADPEPASAKGESAACASSFEQSQVLRKSNQLRAAREELLKCAQLQCRQAIRNQCSAWLEDVESATPSVILEITVNGEDRTDVKVAVDGKPADEWSPAKALELDPGEHLLQVAAPSFLPSEKRIVLREGDKRRVFSFNFGAAKAQAAAPAPTSAPTPARAAEPAPVNPAPAPPPVLMHRPVPAITYVLAGVAVVGGGAFAVLGAKAKQQEKKLSTSCSPACSDKDVDDVKSRYLLANVAVGIGGAAAVGALISYLVRPYVPESENAVQGGVLITSRSAAASALIHF